MDNPQKAPSSAAKANENTRPKVIVSATQRVLVQRPPRRRPELVTDAVTVTSHEPGQLVNCATNFDGTGCREGDSIVVNVSSFDPNQGATEFLNSFDANCDSHGNWHCNIDLSQFNLLAGTELYIDVVREDGSGTPTHAYFNLYTAIDCP